MILLDPKSEKIRSDRIRIGFGSGLHTSSLHSTEQYIHKHNTNYTIQKYIHRKITQCKLHAGMRLYVHTKYFNWLALNMIQRFNARARTRDVILSGNIIFNLQGSMECSEFGAFFRAFPRAPQFFPQRIAGSAYEIGLQFD